MAAAYLTAARARELLHYDPLTGVLTRQLKTCTRVPVGSVCNAQTPMGRTCLGLDNRQYLASRVIWLWMTGKWPDGIVDHKNGVTNDDRWDNLRDVTFRINSQNQRRARIDNKLGYLGVTKVGSGYRASIYVDGRQKNLGMHETPALAHAAYVEAKREHHPGNTL